MSDEIKVGDVCEIFDACCDAARLRVVGVECVALGPFTARFQCKYCLVTHDNVVSISAPRLVACPVKFLRKKPPKQDDSQWIRQETVPLERFNEWRERVRRREPVEETA